MNKKQEALEQIEQMQIKMAELQQEMENLQVEKEKLQEIIDRPENIRWEPNESETYWSIKNDGRACSYVWTNTEEDIYRYQQRNVFKVEELANEARKAQDIQARYFELAELSWEGEKIDWTNSDQEKCFHETSEEVDLYEEHWYTNKSKQNKHYFKTQEALEQAEKEIGSENIIKYVLEDAKNG